MISMRIKKALIKLSILILLIILVLRTITLTLSKFESQISSLAEIDMAFYVLNTDYQSMNLNLGSIVPRDNKYIYRFSVSNYEDNNSAETDMEYDLKILATTNLPLQYSLYLNESYDDENAKSIILENNIIQNADGMYFRELITPTMQMNYTESVLNVYELVVYFPKQYNTTNYQDIIEGIEIIVDSHQIT